MTVTLDQAYDPSSVEPRWAAAWKESGLFSASAAKARGKNPFVMVIPPPNVTGVLHIGHALNNTLQDVLVRFNRLEGREVCWVPGTDHGGIATQNVMEKMLKSEKITRHQLGRDKFILRMQEWTSECRKTILGQLEKLGCGLDWKREAFTMDAVRARAVYEAFETLWKKGVIYRGERMVNWCVRCGTALSDIEVEYEERKGHIWHIHYPFPDGSRGVVVATTRPETMLGDTAVAVNPRDLRYEKLVGRKVRLPLVGREIPIVADEAVEFAFGTGALKVTPAHDVNDFEIGVRHLLDAPKVIGPDGRMTEETGDYAGLSREAARDRILEDLKAVGLLEKTEDHRHSVGVCYRCQQPIEPLLSDQWFVKMSAMAAPAIEAVKSGRFRIFPENWNKPYVEWLSNIRDWCISRQIWWGHRIPVWYCQSCYDQYLPKTEEARPAVSVKKPDSCAACGGSEFLQDPDVLDTWFSSALWPMSVFGWPENGEDMKVFYPSNVLVTGYEILYLWVARMQMMGLETQGEVPFPHALIHGIVRDKKGKKMSKSLGNVVDPLDMMAKYGTDALRFSLIVQAHPGRDIPFSEDSITGARNFVNKVWNSTRFVLMNLPDSPPAGGYRLKDIDPERLELADRWILAEYQKALRETRERLKAYNLAAAADVLYGFLWDLFCKWYVEIAKTRLQGADGEDKETVRRVLVGILNGTLKMLHPFMPFVTEELFSALKGLSGETADFILASPRPDVDRDWSDEKSEKAMGLLMAMISEVRATRSQLNVPPGLKIRVLASGGEEAVRELITRNAGYLKNLARISELEVSPEGVRPPASATAVAGGITFFIPLEGLIDFDKERKRLLKEISRLDGDIRRCAAKLANKNFLERAPKSEIALAREQHETALAKQGRLKETVSQLG